MSLYNQAREEAKSNEGGFRAHVTGKFPGKIDSVKADAYQGREFFEIKVRTQYGIAKTTIWRTSEAADMDHLMNKGITREDAEAEIKKRWTRICRLYNDLGFDAPQDEVALYDELGKLIGAECWVVVKKNDNDSNNPVVFINAPKKNGVATPDQTAAAPQMIGNTSQSAAATPDMDNVPF